MPMPAVVWQMALIGRRADTHISQRMLELTEHNETRGHGIE